MDTYTVIVTILLGLFSSLIGSFVYNWLRSQKANFTKNSKHQAKLESEKLDNLVKSLVDNKDAQYDETTKEFRKLLDSNNRLLKAIYYAVFGSHFLIIASFSLSTSWKFWLLCILGTISLVMAILSFSYSDTLYKIAEEKYIALINAKIIETENKNRELQETNNAIEESKTKKKLNQD